MGSSCKIPGFNLYFYSKVYNMEIKFIRALVVWILAGILLLGCKQKNTSITDSNPETAYYSEQYRPQYHFSPEANWMNDPNGLVFHDGLYHLFYQYYPDSVVWGPMHWGHAVSPDMIRWEHQQVALYPDSLGWIFSGSAVVDKGNTSGLGTNGNDPIIAIFTHHNDTLEKKGSNDFQYQSLAYSNDNGKSFSKFAGNPVLKNPGIRDFRDPKVIWHDRTRQWVMVLAAYDKAMFYTSPDLINWNLSGEFGIPGDTRLWECPDLFSLKVDGTDEEKWILLVSIQQQAPNGGTATAYFTGDFDGKSFKGNNKNLKWLDYGTDNYALVTWSNISDGRVLGIGWMSNWLYAQKVPTQRWRSAMTLPRELKLYKRENDYFISSMPVKELTTIEQESKVISSENMSGRITISPTSGIRVKFKKPAKGKVFVTLTNDMNEFAEIGYDADRKAYFIDRTHAGDAGFYPDFAAVHYGHADYVEEFIEMTVYLDHASIELFADQGKCVMTEILFPSSPFNLLIIPETVKKEDFLSGSYWHVQNIWR